MPYRRRTGLRRTRRNRSNIKRRYRRRIPKSLASRQRNGRGRFYFKRTWRGSLNLQAAIDSNPYLTASQFALQQLPDYTEFTNLFDNYKIHGIRAVFYQPAYGITATEMPTYILHTAVDYNDATAPTSLDQIQQYPSYKSVILREQFTKNGKISRFFKPKVSQAIYSSGVGYAYAETRSPVLSTAYTNVPHYGLKWGIFEYNAQAVAPVTQDADITVPYEFTYYLSFGRSK